MHGQRKLGLSSIQVSPIIFGAWAIGGWMWGGTDEQVSIDAIRAAIRAIAFSAEHYRIRIYEK